MTLPRKTPLKKASTLARTPLKRKNDPYARRARKKRVQGNSGRSRGKEKTVSQLKKELWVLCRKITAKRYPDICFTCDKPVSGSNRQLGHFIPRSTGGTLLRYHLSNLRWQCYHDNINLGGNGSEFYRRLVKEIGQEKVDELFELKTKIVKGDRNFYESLMSEYSAILDSYGETEEGRPVT